LETGFQSLEKRKNCRRKILQKKIGVHAPVIGRYERNDMKPSIKIATKIARALSVSLDYLVGNSSLIAKDNNIMERLEVIADMPGSQKLSSLM
jgi:ribosome-binding protein aMBF1 (putative translation factor)